MARQFKNVTLPDPIELRKISPTEWLLLHDYRCMWTNNNKDYTYTVRVGLITDLSSIPEWARSIIPQIGAQDGPSILHDAMYERREPGWTRKEVDRLFLATMKAAGVRWARRWAMYGAVRAGGGRAWRT